jgi:hypothetical protein
MNPLDYKLGAQAKALVATVIAALSAAVPELSDGHLSVLDGVRIALAAFVAYGAVFGVSNAPANAAKR